MPFISQEGLKQLKQYQYKSGGYSYLDNRINPFWEFVVKLLPLWLAPNLITFIGFANMILASAVQVYYDVTMTKDIPSWSFYYMAFSIFAYQTLDAIDGKQARRTKSSSPLGQLFDHGCDSFILTFFIISLAQCSKMDSTTVFYLFLAVQISLWGLNQKEYHTGLLHTHLYNIGVTEMELIAIACEIVAATLGQNYFHFSLFGVQIYKWITTIILIAGTISNVYIFFSNIKLSKKPMTAFLEWCPFFLFWFLQVKWFEAAIYKHYAGPILINFGIIMSTMVSKMIICSTTRDSFPLFHLEMIPYVVCTALITLIPMQLSTQIQIFQVCFISSIILTLIFLRGVITQITAYLGIHCFTIKKIE